MADKLLELAMTDSVRAAQQRYYAVASPRTGFAPDNGSLSADELTFIRPRDSFYLATASERGWPYIQHRGGQKGFLRVLSPRQLAIADFKGNRQMLSTGNIAANDRICLSLMDYPQRVRLKILGHARVLDAREHPQLVSQPAAPGTQHSVERILLIEVASFNWNCPQHITPRYTAEEIVESIGPLDQRLAELENH